MSPKMGAFLKYVSGRMTEDPFVKRLDEAVGRAKSRDEWRVEYNVLLVYEQLSMQFDEDRSFIPWLEDQEAVHVLSYGEKPGIQAAATASGDLLPDQNHSTICRDYEHLMMLTYPRKQLLIRCP